MALAQAIRRPIVIISNTTLFGADKESLSSIDIGGICLPLDLPIEKCCKAPLVVSYESSHFFALEAIGEAADSPHLITLTDLEGRQLPLQFKMSQKMESQVNQLDMLGGYLQLCDSTGAAINGSANDSKTLCARMLAKRQENYNLVTKNFLNTACKHFERTNTVVDKLQPPQTRRKRQQQKDASLIFFLSNFH